MANYTKTTDFAAKDALSSGDPEKVATGTDVDVEFNAIATAIATKEDSANKNVANGYAGLDSSALVPDARLSSNIPRLNASAAFSGNILRVSGTDPYIGLTETDAGTDAKNWLWQMGSGGNLSLYAYDDALTGSNAALVLTRSGTTVTSFGITSTNLTWNSLNVGFREVPQNSQSGNYTCVLTDNGKHILHPSGAGAGDTFTIPANASVAYPLGAVLTFVNRDSNAVSIAITTDTMYFAGTATTGTRTLAQNGVATAIKVESTVWIISGTGLS